MHDQQQLKTPPELLTQAQARSTWDKFGVWVERDFRIADTGFVPYTQEELTLLTQLISSRRVFEAGAGTGYLARLLSDRGVQIRAIDSQDGPCTQGKWFVDRLYFNVEKIDHNQLEELPGEIILLVWPCYESEFATEVASKLKTGQMLFYRGEGRGGCTASDSFFEILDEQFQHHGGMSNAINGTIYHDAGIHDRWDIYTKR